MEEWVCGPLLLRKTIGKTDCSDIAMPLGHFLEKLEQMAWAPACQQNHCKPLENRTICFSFLREGNIYKSFVLWNQTVFSSKYCVYHGQFPWFMFFPLLKIQDGMLIMAQSWRRSNGSVTALALGSESGTRKAKGSVTRQAETCMGQGEAMPRIQWSWLGHGLGPGRQKLNCQKLERLVKSSEARAWENQ